MNSASMTTIKKYTFSFLTILLALGFMVTEVVQSIYLKNAVSIIILLFILLALTQIRGTIAIITYLLIFLGIILLIGKENIPSIVLEGARTNLTLVAIFIVTPLLGIPVKTGKYIEALKVLLMRMRNNATFFYLGTSLITHGLGFILNIGAVTINYHLTQSSNVRSARLIANALNRGFTTSIFWSPYFAAMALIISQLHIKWEKIALTLFGFSMLSILIGFFIERSFIKAEQERLVKEEDDEVNDEIGIGSAKKKVRELIILIILMMILVLALENFTDFGMVLSICIVSIVFPLVWCFLKGDIKLYRKEGMDHLFGTLPRLRQEITLFLTSGLFSVAYINSPVSDQVIQLLNNYFGFSSVAMTLAILILIISAAIIGMHPIILVTIFATSIDPMQIGLSKEYFAITLLAGWGLSNTISPATAVNNILANSFNKDIMTVSLKWNWKYALIMISILPVYLHVIGH